MSLSNRHTPVQAKLFNSIKSFEDSGKVKTYGLAFTTDNFLSETPFVVIEDISTNMDFVRYLGECISNNDVSSLHIMDIVEDSMI